MRGERRRRDQEGRRERDEGRVDQVGRRESWRSREERR